MPSAVQTNAGAANDLLDRALTELGLKNDAALCRVLKVQPPVISKTRHGRLPFGNDLLIRFHEVTGWGIGAMKRELGVDGLKQYVAGEDATAAA
jgi:hypothetical protein